MTLDLFACVCPAADRFFPSRRASVTVLNRADSLCLAASFDAASPPALWLCDLTKESPVAFRLREESGLWVLGMIRAEGAFSPIARFQTRKEAESAYAAVRRALTRTSRDLALILSKTLRALLLLIVLFVVWALFMVPQATLPAPAKEAVVPQQQTAPAPEKSHKIINGEPMNADDVLVPPAD